jgi:hypothetical protein
VTFTLTRSGRAVRRPVHRTTDGVHHEFMQLE